MQYQLNERHCTICGRTVLLHPIEDRFGHEIGRKIACPNKCFVYECSGINVKVSMLLRPSAGAYRITFHSKLSDGDEARRMQKMSIGRIEKIARRLYWEFGHGDVKNG